MKSFFTIIICATFVLTLCSCKKINDNVSTSSSFSQPDYNLVTSDITSEIQQPVELETESSNTKINTSQPKPVTNINSEPVVDNSSKEPKDTSSEEKIIEDKPKSPINFVPKKWPSISSNGTVDYENASISYYNNVFYKGIRYACTSGQIDGADAWAIVTVGDNDEYLNCISVVDTSSNESSIFNVYNDRIYYLQYNRQTDSKDYEILNSFSICSKNLYSEDKKTEKTIDLPYTHITIEGNYVNSKYLFFTVSNILGGLYDVIYRYDIETKELVAFSEKLGAHNTLFSVENRIFVWDSDNQKIHEYDINFENKKLFDTVDDPHKINSLLVQIKENGFLLSHSNREDKYFLDFSGNRTTLQ